MATLTAWKQDKKAKSQRATKLKAYLCVKCGQTSCQAVPGIRNNVLRGLKKQDTQVESHSDRE